MRKSEVEPNSVSSVLNYEAPKPGLLSSQVYEPNNTSEDSILFWKKQLDNVSPLLALPADFQRSAATSNQINHVFFSFSTSCSDALKQLNNQLDSNLFTILLTAYNTLLFRYTKQEDIVIGLPTIRNIFNEVGEPADSLFNTKLFRTNLSGNPPFNELLKLVQQTVLTIDKYKGVPFETLERVMKLELGTNYTGLYNVMFSYRKTRFENNEINDIAENIILPENYTNNIDLALSVMETNQGLKGVWTYNSELFKAATIKQISNHFEVLLEAIAPNPLQTIAQLKVLIDAEQSLTSELNSSKYAAPRNETETALADIWQEVLWMDRVSINDNFFELGGCSIDVVKMFQKIKEKFHKDLPPSIIFKTQTICQLAVQIKVTKGASSLSSSLIPIQPNGLKTPLFAVHADYGNILFYGNLSLCLGIDQPFYGLQAKGVNGMEFPYSQMEQMASYYVSEIRKVQPEGPYYLAGYCLGAQIAFEMAQQLTHQGLEVALLANFNGNASTYYQRPASNINANQTSQRRVVKESYRVNNISELRLKEKLSLTISQKFIIRVFHMLERLYLLLRSKLYESLFKFYRFCNQKVPGTIARNYVDIKLNMLQFNYKPKPYSGSMIIFRSPGKYKDQYLGWQSLVKGEIKTFDILGLHLNRKDIMNRPYVQFLAEELKKNLDK
ncbi:MAG: non-ribosomal peptide synthase [Mucilaginibacter sp.]|nr:non-ribosomal peptide synthase [Mucilaginibacter sp.]